MLSLNLMQSLLLLLLNAVYRLTIICYNYCFDQVRHITWLPPAWGGREGRRDGYISIYIYSNRCRERGNSVRDEDKKLNNNYNIMLLNAFK